MSAAEKEIHGKHDNSSSRMFISKQSMDGLKITVNSLIEAVQFLLEKGMPLVLTEKFCQDASEEYFRADIYKSIF